MIDKNDVKGLVRSFNYSFKGIAYCIKNERNMRIHLSMIVLVSIFSYFYKVTSTQYILLLICMGIVVSAEMINTAIETLTNLESPSYNTLARIAKDVAAGAVFISAVLSIVVGLIIFLDINRIIDTFKIILSNPLYWSLCGIIVVLSVLFTFNGVTLFGAPKVKVYTFKNFNDDKNNRS